MKAWALPVAAGALSALVCPGVAGTETRATADRPDDVRGAQVHAVYAVPSDGADRGPRAARGASRVPPAGSACASS